MLLVLIYNKNTMKKLNLTAFSLASGVTLGLGVFLLALMSEFLGIGINMLNIISSVYIGTSASLLGSLFGFVWGFADGFTAAFIFALVYNFSIKYFK